MDTPKEIYNSKHFPGHHLFNAGDHRWNIENIIRSTRHPAVRAHQEIGGYAPDQVQLSNLRLPSARGVDVDAGHPVLIDRPVPLVGGVQRDDSERPPSGPGSAV